MPFVKLDCGMLDSTLWFERSAREVFITALLMAEPFEAREPLPQIAIRSLDYTGWSVPVGWYGFVRAAGVGILHRAGIDTEVGLTALEQLGSPESGSRTPDHDGRRLVRVDGGFIVLNFIKYRERDATTADRSKRWRERQREKSGVTGNVSSVTTRVIRHQAEAEAEAEADKNIDQEQAPRTRRCAKAVENRKLMLKLAHDLIDSGVGPSEIKDALKESCGRASVKYDADSIRKTLDAVERSRA